MNALALGLHFILMLFPSVRACYYINCFIVMVEFAVCDIVEEGTLRYGGGNVEQFVLFVGRAHMAAVVLTRARTMPLA